ncbi:hypothetical protein X274_07955 [Marinitoga sp. 1155]|nr:hypothetical protein X274_09100 [Marinitoga sp. 1155]KLO22530.1 hypothetical protein X274_07955 [Marinitoga sp. 1155]
MEMIMFAIAFVAIIGISELIKKWINKDKF